MHQRRCRDDGIRQPHLTFLSQENRPPDYRVFEREDRHPRDGRLQSLTL